MKKFGLVVLGLLALLVTFITAIWALHDRYFVFEMFIPLASGYGAITAFRKAGSIGRGLTADWSNPAAEASRDARPWER